MKRAIEDTSPAPSEAPRNRLLLWLAAGLAPETAPWFLGYMQPLHRHIQPVNAETVTAADPQAVDPEVPAEAPRRAA